MSSKEDPDPDPGLGLEERSPLDQLPPPAHSNKPLTPFSIEDILSKPSVVRRGSVSVTGAVLSLSPGDKPPSAGHIHTKPPVVRRSSVTGALLSLSPGDKPPSVGHILTKPPVVRRSSVSVTGASLGGSPGEKPPSAGHSPAGRPLISHTSPLCALEELASKTFKGLEVSVLQAAEGRDGLTLFGHRSTNTPRKRRKSRTAFTNHQIYELEKRFLFQKYLSPADRDHIAGQLGLTNPQVITWFQNRRAKLKRDLEEMKADVESAKMAVSAGNGVLDGTKEDAEMAVGTGALEEKLSKLAELEKCAAAGAGRGTGGGGGSKPDPKVDPPVVPVLPDRGLDYSRPGTSPPSPASSWFTDRRSSRGGSEDEDEEIDVDD